MNLRPPASSLPPSADARPLVCALLSVSVLPIGSFASPVGPVVQNGNATITTTGNHTQITASHNAFIHWASFDLRPGESASFVQPSESSVVWNRIHGANPSEIHGSIQANGVVVLMNEAGFHFGPSAFVSAAGLVVSTAPVTPVESGSGLFWQFQGAPPGIPIVNYGRIQVGSGGSAFLIADRIQNHGTVTAPEGSISLAAGRDVLISERPDGRGLSAQVRLPSGSIDQSGRLVADAGTIALHAQVVRQTGQLQANALRERDGVIELYATDINLGSSSTPPNPGGPPPATLDVDVNSGFVGASRIHIEATRNITLSTGTAWDLPSSTGNDEPGNQLTLSAGQNITLANGSSLAAGQNWSITLQAGRDFTAPDAFLPGVGSIALSGNATLQTGAGDIRLTAGNQISVASGAVRTVAGGDISARAIAGSIQTGTRPNGFVFRPNGYSVDPALGGISTAAGGDVHLSAGTDIISHLPLAGGNQANGGSGAFGTEPGNVTLEAGRDVAGHFVVRNGQGSVQAGRDAGTPQRQLALSLVRGGWTIEAARDVILQEIRNPNGLFNNLGSTASASRHRFDYDPLAFADIRAGRGIELRGTALPRYLDVFSQSMPPIYPGILSLEAGAGGVKVGNDLVLFPSAFGHLDIRTTDGGGLTGTKPGDLAQIVLSDSAKSQYRAFGDFGISDHGPDPFSRVNRDPVRIDIDGDMSGILLGLPKRTEIRVGGNMINSRLEAQHLDLSDVSRIEVAGDIRNRSEFTHVPLDAEPDFTAFLLDLFYPQPAGSLAGVENRFSYNKTTRTLTFQGRMTGEQLQFLRAAPVRVFDSAGIPVLLPNGEPLTRPVELIPAAALERLYAESQDIPLNPDTGYRIGGGGRLEILARNLDLGATAGIVSHGPRANAALATAFDQGADVLVSLTGNLDMFSTRIATLAGGSITLAVDGHVNAGSRDFVPADATARGIYTVDTSDVTVVARGNIQLNGSRIAAYDGGNVTVRSLEGSIDAGAGGNGAATVEKIVVDPVTRRVLAYAPTIPGSGILATTFPPSLDPSFPSSQVPVGNILVETPRGDIIASSGGIVQVPLNGLAGDTAGTVTLRAGTRDAAGNVVHTGNIDASGSGVIGTTVRLEASGSIQGLVFARESIDLAAVQNVNVTALAQGSVSVAAGGNISGTLVGVGSVSAAGGGTVDAALLSQNVSTSGDTGGAQVGFTQGTAANSASQGAQAEDPEQVANAATPDSTQEDERKRPTTAAPRLTRTTGRVTVILP